MKLEKIDLAIYYIKSIIESSIFLSFVHLPQYIRQID